MSDKLEIETIIVIDLEDRGNGLWFATSRMMSGFMVAGNTRQECLDRLPSALADMASVCRDTDPPSTRESAS